MKVFEIAPAKVLQGAVRLHGLRSSPTPETQVRVAWACAGADTAKSVSVVAARTNSFDLLCIFNLLNRFGNVGPGRDLPEACLFNRACRPLY
jgi:hypothetical protein